MKRVLSIILAVLLSVSTLCSCSFKDNSPKEEQIKAICELATVECYYNNVAKSTKEAGTGWTHLLEKEREFWIEYEGVAKIGIDMSLVTMKINKDVVTITVPKAELLSVEIVTFNKDSYKISKDSFWNHNKITLENQQDAIESAQNEMRETVNANKALFEQAEERAKTLIENYVNKLGELSGKEYQIKWKEIKK